MAETRLKVLCALSFLVCWLAALLGWLLLPPSWLTPWQMLWALALLVALFTVGLIMLVLLDGEAQEDGHGPD